MGRVMRIVAVCGIMVVLFARAYAPSTAATIHDVAIEGFTFQPGSLSVSVGDIVQWTNNDSAPHTTTSTTGVWNSGTLTYRQQFSFTFTTAGMYLYLCAIHPSMRGTIVVSAGPLPTSTVQPPTTTLVPTQAPISTPGQSQYRVDLPLITK